MTVLLKDLTPIVTKESLKDIIEKWVVKQIPVRPVSLVETDKGIVVTDEDEGGESHGYCFDDLFVAFIPFHDALEEMSVVSVHHNDEVYLYPTGGSAELRFFYAKTDVPEAVTSYDENAAFLVIPEDGVITNIDFISYLDVQKQHIDFDIIEELTYLVSNAYISNTAYYNALTRENYRCFIKINIPEGA